MTALEITTEGWIAIIAAMGGFVTVLGGVMVSVIVAIRTGQKADVAQAVAAQARQTLHEDVKELKQTVAATPPVAAVPAQVEVVNTERTPVNVAEVSTPPMPPKPSE